MCVFNVSPLPNMLRADSQCFASGSEFELQITVTQFPVVIYAFDLVVDSEDQYGHATQHPKIIISTPKIKANGTCDYRRTKNHHHILPTALRAQKSKKNNKK